MKALITGASSGIGRDMARYLASFGYDLFLVSRNKDKLKDLSEELKVKVKIIELDLVDSDNCFKLYEMLKKEKIDFLTEKLSKNSPTSLSGEMNYSFFISYLQTIDILYKD